MEFKSLRNTLTVVLTAGGWVACGGDSDGGAETAKVSLLAFSDLHGRLENGGNGLLLDAANPNGTRASLGGVAHRGTLIKKRKSDNPTGSILIAHGDLVGASPLISRAFHEEPTIEILNEPGLAVSSVGNHEFDYGNAELLRLTQGGCFKGGVAGVDPCLSHGQFEGAKFQYLAANVIDNSAGKLLPPGDTIRTLNAVKVGFIGLTLAWPATTSSTTAVST